MAVTKTHKLGILYYTDAGLIVNQTPAFTADGELDFAQSIATGVTDQVINMAIVRANVVSILISSTQNVTIHTYSSVPALVDTIPVVAGIPIVWNSAMVSAIFLSANAASLKITNASGQTADVIISVLVTI